MGPILVDFGLPKPSKMNRVPPPPFCILKVFVFQVMLCIASRWRKSRPRGSKTPPRRLQDAPKSAPGGFKRASRDPKSRQEGSKPAQELPRASQDAHKAFPKHLARQPFSENSQNANHGSKRHRRNLRSPISMNPKGLASNRKMKKGGRAAVIPLGEVNKKIYIYTEKQWGKHC